MTYLAFLKFLELKGKRTNLGTVQSVLLVPERQVRAMMLPIIQGFGKPLEIKLLKTSLQLTLPSFSYLRDSCPLITFSIPFW